MRNPRKFLKALLLKSATIQMRIDDAMKARYPDTMRVLMLKKQRLAVKDLIMRIKRRMRSKKQLVLR